MKKKMIKKKLTLTMTPEIKLLAEKYEEMARNGWLVEKVRGAFDHYVKVEPMDLDFSVTMYEAEGIPDEKHKDYQAYCEASGWQYVTHNDLYHVYAKPKALDGVPIHTDPETEYKSILKVFMRTEFMTLVLALLHFGILGMQLDTFTYRDIIFSRFNLSILAPVVTGLLLLLLVLPSIRFMIHNYIRLKRGKDIKYDSLKRMHLNQAVRNVVIVLGVSLLLMMLLSAFMGKTSIWHLALLSGVLVGVYVVFYLLHIKHSRKENLLMSVVVNVAVCVGSVIIIFSVMGSHLGEKQDKFSLPETRIITFEDLGYDYPSEPDVDRIDSTFLAPLSFSYTLDYHSNEMDAYMRVEYIEVRYQWVKDILIPLLYQYEGHYDGEIIPITQLAEGDIDVYQLTNDQEALLVIKDLELFKVRYNDPIEEELLNHLIESL